MRLILTKRLPEFACLNERTGVCNLRNVKRRSDRKKEP